MVKTIYMRLLIILLLVSNTAFGQYDPVPMPMPVEQRWSDTVKQKVDTLNAPILSINEVMSFLNSINKKLSAVKELDLPKDQEYNEMVKELNRIVGILEKKKKAFK